MSLHLGFFPQFAFWVCRQKYTWAWARIFFFLRFFREGESSLITAHVTKREQDPTHFCTAGQKILKSPGQKNSSNEINQFQDFLYFPFSESKILIFMENIQKNISWNWFIWNYKVFWPGLFKIFWPALCFLWTRFRHFF